MAKRGRPPKDKTKEEIVVETEEKVEDVKAETKTEPKKVEKKVEEKKEDTRPNLNVSKPSSVSKESRDLNEMIPVKNITNSSLVYISKNNHGLRIDWTEFGEEVYIEYKELVNMRGSQRRFFEQPWIVCDWEVLEDLRVDQYYKDLIDLDNLDDIFALEPSALGTKLEKLPRGVRQLVADRANELVRNKELDSMNKIRKIEQVLKIDLGVS